MYISHEGLLDPFLPHDSLRSLNVLIQHTVHGSVHSRERDTEYHPPPLSDGHSVSLRFYFYRDNLAEVGGSESIDVAWFCCRFKLCLVTTFRCGHQSGDARMKVSG